MARIAMVVYWRLINASAPSLIASEMVCMLGVPVSRLSTSFASHAAKSIAKMLMENTSVSKSSADAINIHPQYDSKICRVSGLFIKYLVYFRIGFNTAQLCYGCTTRF